MDHNLALFHDNASICKSISVSDFLSASNIKILNIASKNHYLNPKEKNMTGGDSWFVKLMTTQSNLI